MKIPIIKINSIALETKNKPTLIINILGYLILFAYVDFFPAIIIFILMITEINFEDKTNGKT